MVLLWGNTLLVLSSLYISPIGPTKIECLFSFFYRHPIIFCWIILGVDAAAIAILLAMKVHHQGVITSNRRVAKQELGILAETWIQPYSVVVLGRNEGGKQEGGVRTDNIAVLILLLLLFFFLLLLLLLLSFLLFLLGRLSFFFLMHILVIGIFELILCHLLGLINRYSGGGDMLCLGYDIGVTEAVLVRNLGFLTILRGLFLLLGLVLLHSGKFLPKIADILCSTVFVTVLCTEGIRIPVFVNVSNVKGVLLLVVFHREDITRRHLQLIVCDSPYESCSSSLRNFFIAQ